MSGVFIIAEVAQAHDGSLGIAHSYIDALAETGVNAIKFQTHIAEAESSIYEPFRVKFSREDATRFDYWKRMEFSFEQWSGLKKHCDDVGLEFMSSPFSNAAVELLERVGVTRYKVGSGEILNHLLLHRIGMTRKPIILSSGMSNFNEVQDAVNLLNKFGCPVSILQCTTQYPTHPEQWGLNVIKEMQERFKVPIGFSDHSGDIFASLGAAALGASILEFHVVFDKRMFGPDAVASLTIDEVKKTVKGVREIERAIKSPVLKNDTKRFDELKTIFGKSLAVNKDLQRGYRIQLNDLESKKPSGYGIPAKDFENVIGKTLNKNLTAYSFLTGEDIE